MTLLREQRYRVERLVDVAASQVVQREIDGVPVLLTGTNLLPEHLVRGRCCRFFCAIPPATRLDPAEYGERS